MAGRRFEKQSIFKLLLALILIAVFLQPSAFAYNSASDFDPYITSPNKLSIFLYNIKGKNLAEIKQQMLAKGPVSYNGGRHYAATNWYIKWQWPQVDNLPDYSRTVITDQVIIVLPYAAIQEAERQHQWEKYFKLLVKHELQHAFHGLDCKIDILKILRSFNGPYQAKLINKEISKIIASAQQKDLEYDLFTKHGKSEGIDF